jgi:hypothetical protein
MKIGADGKLGNPETSTDSEGRFTIVADRRFWEGTGKFTLRGGFLPGTGTNAGYLRGSDGAALLISIDAQTNRLDLGDIRLKTGKLVSKVLASNELCAGKFQHPRNSPLQSFGGESHDKARLALNSRALAA